MSNKTSYIHGFDPKEQARLVDQAELLKPYVYPHFNAKGLKNLLEVGCGVGAQTQILLTLNRTMRVTSIDASAVQLEKAAHNLSGQKRVRLVQVGQEPWPLKREFDGAFFCWVLEHVTKPEEILLRTRKVLKPGGRIFVNEVYNQSFRILPGSKAVDKFWAAACQMQRDFGGDPDVGSRLDFLLRKTGYKDIRMGAHPFTFDALHPNRVKLHKYFTNLLESIAPQLISTGALTKNEVDSALTDFRQLLRKKDACMFYTMIHGTARA